MTYPAIEENDTYTKKVQPVIAALMKIPALAGGLTELLNDPKNSIEFLETKSGILNKNGGAATDPSRNWLDDGMSFLIYFNEQDVKRMVKCESGVEPSLKEIIAHELGHAYYIRYKNQYATPSDKKNCAFAVQWEAHARGTPDQVREHNISASCCGISVPAGYR